MSAVFAKRISASTDGIDEVHALNASTRTATNVMIAHRILGASLKGNENRGTSVFFRNLGCGDSDNARMPIVIGDNEDSVVFKATLLLYSLVQISHDNGFLILPFGVQLTKMLCQQIGCFLAVFIGIGKQKQLQRP